MRILVCPAPSYSNSYLALFCTHLEEAGGRVVTIGRSRALLRKILMWKKADVLNLHWLEFFTNRSTKRAVISSTLLLTVLCIAKVRGIRIYWTVHNLAPHTPRHKLIESVVRRTVSLFSDGVVSMTPSAQDIIAKACNIPTFKLSVIPHPNYVRRIGSRIDRKAARKLLGIPNDAVIIGFCGAIREYKGIDLLIRAFREIKNRSIELLIAGEPESSRIHSSILKEIESCEEKRITFIPRFLSEDELATWLTAIDLTVLPYRKILNSGSLLYSLSLGVPVVIPQVQELSDFIGLPGVLPYTPRESSSLREVIEGYFENGEMNAAIERQARSTAQAFDPREVALHYYKLFSRREAQYFFPKIKVLPKTTTSTQPIE